MAHRGDTACYLRFLFVVQRNEQHPKERGERARGDERQQRADSSLHPAAPPGLECKWRRRRWVDRCRSGDSCSVKKSCYMYTVEGQAA